MSVISTISDISKMLRFFMSWIPWWLLFIGLLSTVHGQSSTCTHDRDTGSPIKANAIIRDQDSVTFTDEQYIEDFEKWGSFCCNNRAISFAAALPPNAPGQLATTCNHQDPGNFADLKLQVNKTDVACDRNVAGYVLCDIYIRGNISRYFDRKRGCTYIPVPVLSCINGTPGALTAFSLSSFNASFSDENRAPQWNTAEKQILISEYTFSKTLLVDPLDAELFVTELTDIWGSPNWNITLSLRYPNGGFTWAEIDASRTIYADPSLSNTVEERTLPAVRLTRRIPYAECSSYDSPCELIAELVATDGNGLSSSITLRLTITDENDRPPVFDQLYDDVTIEEDNESAATFPQVSAHDQDTGIKCRIIYSIGNVPPFVIDNATGQLGVNGELPVWSPNGTNTFVIVVTATEDESFDSEKCSRKMVATTSVVVKMTSPRSTPVDITTEPTVIVARKFDESEQELALVDVRRNGQPVSDVGFAIVQGDNFWIDQENGTLYKKTGVLINATASVVVSVTDAKNRPLGQISLTVAVDHPIAPKFSQPLYETDVYSDQDIAVEDLITEKPNNCNLTIQEKDGPVLNATNGISSSDWLNWVNATKSYRSVYTAICEVPNTPLSATAELVVNWHPLPQFDSESYSSVLVKEETGARSVVAVVTPVDDFPYPLNFVLDGDSDLFAIDNSTGRLSIIRPLSPEDPSHYLVMVLASEPGRENATVSVYVEVIPTVPIPARWMEPVDPVSCNSNTRLPISAEGEELSDLTVTIVGANGDCATIIPEANGNGVFDLSVRDTAECGVTFSLVLLLGGKHTQETMVVDVTGCPAVIDPVFNKAVEEIVFYFDSTPVQTSTIENCPDCICQFLDENVANEIVQVDDSGRVTITAIPPFLTSYSSTYTVQCTSTSSAKSARTVIRIEWHPQPRFQNSSEISVLEPVANGTVIQTIHPLDDFPYPLQYNFLDSQSPFVVHNGHLILERTFNLQPSYDLVIAAGEPSRTPVNISIKVNIISVPPPLQPATFINQTIWNLPCNGSPVNVAVDIGSENWSNISFDALTNRPNHCLSLDTGTVGTLLVTPNRNGPCGEEFTTAVGLSGPNSPLNVVILEFVGCEISDVPTPSFPETFHTLDSFFDDPILVQSPAVKNCTNCNCTIRAISTSVLILSSHVQLDPATGSLSVQDFPEGSVFRNSRNYQSTYEINCRSPASTEAAVIIVQINWHPQPVIRTGPVITTRNDTTSGTVLASLLPSYNFPYPLVYSLASPEVPFAIDDTNLIVKGELNNSQYTLRIVAGEPGHPVNLTIEIIVEPTSNDTINTSRPAKFAAQMLTVPCNATSTRLPVYAGDEDWSSMIFSPVGANSNCFTLTHTDGAVTVSAAPEVHCGENFPAAVSLQGLNSASADIIVLHFTGCSVPPKPPTPGFPQSVYRTHWYYDSTSGHSTPTVNCSDCDCTMASLNASETFSFVELDGHTGSINITRFPEPVDKYLSTLEVRCLSRSSKKAAAMIIQIFWHPVPDFPIFINPVPAVQNSQVDVIVVSLNPVQYFPYPIEYHIQNSSDYPFKIADGALILKGEAFELEQSDYTVNIHAGEPNHFTDILVNVNVSRPLPVLLPAKFAQTVFPNSPCDQEVKINVGTNGYNWADLGFEILFDSGNCARLERFEAETAVTVIPDPEQNCGEEFSVAVRMLNKVTNATDTALVQFVGCRGTPTTTTVLTDTNTTQSSTPATTGTNDPGATSTGSSTDTTITSTETAPAGETDSTITTTTMESNSSATTVTSTTQNTTSQTTRPADGTNSTDTTTTATTATGSGAGNSTIPTTVPFATGTGDTTTKDPSNETDSTITTTATHFNTSDTTITSTQSTITTTYGNTTVESSSANTTTSILRPTDPPGPSNLLSQYSGRFSETAGKFFDFNTSSKELHIKDLPDSASTFHLDFVADSNSATRTDQNPRAETYVLSVRMLSGAVKTLPPAAFGTTEIILVVVGALLLIAVIVIFVGFLKLKRQRKPKIPVDSKKPVVNGIKKDLDIELAHKTTEMDRPIQTMELDRPIIVTAPPSHHGGTITSVPFLGSLREDSDSDTVSSHRGGSIGSAPGEFEPDHMKLVDNENSERESTDSILSGEVIHNPAFEYEATTEPPTTASNSEPSVKVIQETEPEPDYPVNVAPPPPPPPPVVIDVPEIKRTASRENVLEPPRKSDGENFLNELKTAVSNPYIVLKAVDNGSSSDSEADRKVRFGPAVEVITSAPASPALPHDIHSPPLPAYSPMLSHSLAKNTTLIMPSPPSPAYITPLKLAGQTEPAVVIPSPPVPAYKSSVDKRLQRQESVEKEDEIVSYRQISRDKITEPPPLPAANTVPFLQSPDETANRYLPNSQADDDNDESRTAL